MKLTSSAFSNNEMIPEKYTCDGENINPPLKIAEIPNEAKSLALIVDDPDAPMGTFNHWVVWNIDTSVEKIDENSLPAGAAEGRNDFGRTSYGGPCPPSGTHRYFFKVFALSEKLNLEPSAQREDLERAMEGRILEKTELVGLYRRK